MFKNILVPIDLTHAEKSSALLDRAKEVADQHSGKLTLLNVIPEIPPYVTIELPKDMHEKVVTNARAKLRELVKKHKISASTEFMVEHGHPMQEILKAATSTHADLILVASHQPGLSDYLLGSVAGKVVRHAHCSVMVLR